MAAALYFQKRFVSAIKAGTKTQTIRRTSTAKPPKVGEPLKLRQGIGSGTFLPIDPICTSVEAISLSTNTGVVALLHAGRWQYLSDQEIEELAYADGFEDSDDFFNFFDAQYGQTFSGWLIKWSLPQPAQKELA